MGAGGGYDLAAVWRDATEEIADEIVSAQQRAYLRRTRLRAIVEDTALLSVPDAFTRDQIEWKLRPAITDALSRRLGRAIQVAVTLTTSDWPGDQALTRTTDPAATGEGSWPPAARVPEPRAADADHPATPDPEPAAGPEVVPVPVSPALPPSGSPAADTDAPPADAVPVPPDTEDPPVPAGPATIPPERDLGRPDLGQAGQVRVDPSESGPGRGERWVAQSGGNRLNSKYTFETFVIGSSNRFAHAAAVAVAESPAKAYNPLFVYGSSGLGKTHLLHAIGHYASQLGNARAVRYVSTEEFTNDFINSVRDDKSSAFQRRYRDVDVLLIDDIQFLETRERTQEEFFHTFNTLHNTSKQIVITSDRSPKQLSTLEDRLRTRFE